MKVFVDAGPFIALSNKDDSYHDNAKEQFKRVKEREETVFTSDYILDEAISYATGKAKRLKAVLELDHLIQNSALIRILKVDDEILTNSKIFLRTYPKLMLTLTDWTCVALLKKYGIEKLYSYDSDFDKLKETKNFKYIERVETL